MGATGTQDPNFNKTKKSGYYNQPWNEPPSTYMIIPAPSNRKERDTIKSLSLKLQYKVIRTAQLSHFSDIHVEIGLLGPKNFIIFSPMCVENTNVEIVRREVLAAIFSNSLIRHYISISSPDCMMLHSIPIFSTSRLNN